MNRWIRHSAAGRGLFAVALLLVLAIRVLIPTGFMPGQTSGGVVISLCTGQGAVNVLLETGKKAPADSHHEKSDGLCSFATGLSGGPLSAGTFAAVTAFATAVAEILGTAIADLTVHRLAAPPPPALGPPALS